MSIDLRKKTGINLKKGSKISLAKEEKSLENVCIGINWGIINKKSWLGLLNSEEKVDLDGIVTTFGAKNQVIYSVYYKNLISPEKAIHHSGDDRVGDSGGDDGLDNELISLELSNIDHRVQQIVFFLNSYNGQSFAEIPYANIRIYEGTKYNMVDVLATFNLATDKSYEKYCSMIMGKLVRVQDKWEFKAIGEPTLAFTVSEINQEIKKLYLD